MPLHTVDRSRDGSTMASAVSCSAASSFNSTAATVEKKRAGTAGVQSFGAPRGSQLLDSDDYDDDDFDGNSSGNNPNKLNIE